MITLFRTPLILILMLISSSFVEPASNIVKIYLTNAFGGGDASDDKEKILALINSSSPSIWVFTGNSITQGAKHTHGLRAYPEIFGERIRFEIGRSRDFVINTAISGNTTRDILNDFDRRIGSLSPKVVSLMIGTNDAAVANSLTITQFEHNLTQLLVKIRSIGAVPILLTPPTIIEAKAPERDRLFEYVNSIRSIAARDHVILVDNWLIWSSEMKIKYNNQVNYKLLNDPLHPNGLGHKEIAIAIFKELSIFNANSPTCGGPYYEGQH